MTTVEEVRAAVEEIRRLADDDEAAHSAEDALHQNVLASIAQHDPANAASLAREALKTQDIEFARWCA